MPKNTANPIASFSSSKRGFLRSVLGLAALGFGSHPAAEAAQTGGLEQFYKFNIKPETWLAEVFGGAVPPPSVLDGASGSSAGLIQPLPQRLRYWRANGRTAWIFDELGKDGYAPTTCGFVVKGGAVESAKVLIYRESRGEQVGQPSFLQQLVGTTTSQKPVDNISGATYSVKMMQRMASKAVQLDALAK